MSSARVIVLEGIDGAGTSTVAQGLCQWLESRGLSVLATHQPSPLPSGQQIRELLRTSAGGELRKAALALAFAADRLLLWEQIQKTLESGTWVICDRSKMSSLVYQGSELPEAWVREINRFAPEADLTLLLDLPAETAMARIEGRGGQRDRFETLGILTDLAQRYRGLAEDGFSGPVITVNAAEQPADVLAAAKRAVEALD